MTLPIVNIAAINHVARVDEELCSPHSLEEVTWSLHLRHELDEELGASICVNTLHKTIDSTNKSGGRRKSIVVNDRRIISIHIRHDSCLIYSRSRRSKNRNGVVGRAMRHHAHGDEHDHEIEENGKVGQDAEFLECADLTEAKAAEGPDKTANGIAKFELGDLRKGLAVADDDVTYA